MQQEQVSVLIGIQARSSSERLPKKAFELIDGKRMLDCVIDSCKGAASYLNRTTDRSGIYVQTAVLTPAKDPIVEAFSSRCPIYEGPEHDVLTRFVKVAEKLNPDFIVRITGDCPLIPPFIISKMIKLAISQDYDYISNVDEESRTTLDGHDCEVLSAEMLRFLDEHATDPYDREHVTTLARRSPPDWASMGCVINHLDHSSIKLSVDTPEDLARVKEAKERVNQMVKQAERKFGRFSVHRL